MISHFTRGCRYHCSQFVGSPNDNKPFDSSIGAAHVPRSSPARNSVAAIIFVYGLSLWVNVALRHKGGFWSMVYVCTIHHHVRSNVRCAAVSPGRALRVLIGVVVRCNP